jgi:hypothetical protein
LDRRGPGVSQPSGEELDAPLRLEALEVADGLARTVHIGAR